VVAVAVAWSMFLSFITPTYRVHKEGVVVVTGASTGIGKDAALWLDKHGYHVFAGVRKQTDADNLKREASQRFHPIILDVTSHDDIVAALSQVTSFLESSKLPLVGLVNNAGVGVGSPVESINMKLAHWVYDVNVFGLLDITKEFIPLLRTHQGRIVNVGSVAGLVAGPFTSIYAGTKFAVEAISDSLRRELGPQGVSVSLLEPAYVKTPILDKSLEYETPSEEIIERYNLKAKVEKSKKLFAWASPTTVTTDAIFNALTDASPKTRYVVANVGGIPASFITFLLWLFPDRVIDLFI